MWNFLGTLGGYFSWLYHDREWAIWELIGLAVVLVVVPFWIFKRLRRKSIRRVYGSHFLDGASVIGVKLADQSRNHHKNVDARKAGSMHPAERRYKQEEAAKKVSWWRRAVEQVKDKPSEIKLEAELAELTATYEQPRKEAGENTQIAESVAQTTPSSAATDAHVHHESMQISEPIEQRITELTAANEKLRQELAENIQAKEPLEQELAGQTSVNEQLRKEIADIKQVEERLGQKVAELTAANEQLQRELSECNTAAPKSKGGIYEKRHRVVKGIDQKLCDKCGQWKAEDQYYKHASSRDGLANQCKQCRTGTVRRRRAKRNAAKN